MGVDLDYKQLATLLLSSYTKGMLELSRKRKSRRLLIKSQADSRILSTVQLILSDLGRYNVPSSLEKALDTIDLAKIYEGVDQREHNQDNSDLGYEDFVVQETLKYFKDDFFTWVTKPKCPSCQNDGENIIPTGSAVPPAHNPDQISNIEVYTCQNCRVRVEFPRINNPATLLDTRRGRCGEWVNCFMLILKAVLGSEVHTRYIWNAEDHVWCEYYSIRMKRWIHLDPCENVFDEPSLYCKNWGKKMSWVIGIGENYVCDLSEKYVTESDRAIPKSTVASEATVAEFLEHMNAYLLLQKWDLLLSSGLPENDNLMQIYDNVLLPQARERTQRKPAPSKTEPIPKGRQTGDALWTAARGEDG